MKRGRDGSSATVGRERWESVRSRYKERARGGRDDNRPMWRGKDMDAEGRDGLLSLLSQ